MERTLHELFPHDWGSHQPTRLSELLAAEYDSLDEQARGVRALLVDAIHGFEREPVLTAAACRALLEKHHLPKPRNRWALIALNDRRERVYVKVAGGGLRMLSTVKEHFPSAAVAAKEVPLPEGGVYLAVHGGPIDILSDGKAFDRACDLASTYPLADVVCWDDDGHTATFWSVAAGGGAVGSTELELPDPSRSQSWRNLLCTR